MFYRAIAGYVCLSVVVVVYGSAAGTDQKAQERPGEEIGLFIGGGVLLQDKPFAGVDPKVYPLPFYMYRGKAFSIRGLSASYEFLADEGWAVRALAKIRPDGYESNDSSDLDGMSDRRHSLDLGAELWLENSWGNVALEGLTDALSVHHGHEASLTYSKRFRAVFGIEKLALRPMAGVSWRSDNLNNYYYGVRAKEARPGRPQYKSGESINPFAGVGLDYRLAERWSIFAMFRNEWLPNEITDSPIIDQDNVISVILGLVYRM
ncbi:MAG: MipA/OmpV family protein [Planctomycetota bacterium]|jgi:outer membrane protein